MKTINETFDDKEYEKLKKEKGKLSWHDFILIRRKVRSDTIKIRKEFIKEHNSKCDHCNSIKNLQIHHPHYDYLSKKELLLLCRKCHVELHKKIPKVRKYGIALQLDIPQKLMRKVNIYSKRNDFVDKRDTVIFILEKELRDVK